ncbi:MAG: tRNA (adenosine(37)-N6)-threonylcarbamoyltransferase complex dimerization subunit type 1 TsaB [Bacteroidales bacterium]|jgi:tRNA threonylcarbamoyladenosine biosynthesis protein TsaB
MTDPILLLIETSTESCSVALSSGDKIIAERTISAPKQHASLLAPFIKEVIEQAGISISNCTAIAVSEGPGSYTGLRVGISTVKGLCFGANKPLLAVGTLEILAMQGIKKAKKIVPMIDARRMEVYTAIFNSEGIQESKTEALILDENSFKNELENNTVLFIGDGVNKFRSIINHPNAYFESCCPNATYMLTPALKSLQKKEFKDVAYFEPLYLKEFVIGISKKSIL